jgi:hypothetical protein
MVGLIPMILGSGIYPLLVPALLAALVLAHYAGATQFSANVQTLILKPGYLVLLLSAGLFLSAYLGLYIPYHPNILTMPWAYFPLLLAICFITLVWIACLEKELDLIGVIFYFCLGALVYCLVTIGTSMLIEHRMLGFYGGVSDIRYLPFGIKRSLNTPGIANLLSLFPAAFLAGILLKSNQRPKGFWILGATGLALSLVSAVAIGQRSYFVLVLAIMPLIVGFFLLLLGRWRSSLAVFFCIASYPFLLRVDQLLGTGFLSRVVNHSLLSDARFVMFQFWIDRLIESPFLRPEVGPAPWDSLQWFHNFFADVHRLSGFWALLTAVILVGYIFLRVLCVIKREKRLGLFLMSMAICCFLIMNTSVVPEGERQPFLLLLAIGVISEVILARLPKKNTDPK